MTTDTAQKLRDFVGSAPHDYPGHNIKLFEEAAAEIERLRRELDDARLAISGLNKDWNASQSLLAATWEKAAKIAETGVAEMEAEHRGWREAFGERSAQPYEREIDVRREIAAALRAAGKEVSERNSTQKAVTPLQREKGD